VQVKSGDGPVDLPALNQLIGAMHNSKADQGLFVSWGGFKQSVDKETASQFFQVRLWNQSKLVEELLAHYENLDASLRAELPLKRVWTIATPDEDET
jgi:restriction system protein